MFPTVVAVEIGIAEINLVDLGTVQIAVAGDADVI
jgi:hypothetical protein